MLAKALAVEGQAEDVTIRRVWLPAGKGGFKHRCSAWKYNSGPSPLPRGEGKGQDRKTRDGNRGHCNTH